MLHRPVGCASVRRGPTDLRHGLLSARAADVHLVVDEEGYLTYGTDASNMLFHVVNECHRRHRPMIFTTKIAESWGRVLHDEDLAQVLRLDGPSVRTLHVNLDDAMKEDSDQGADLVRISGTHANEALLGQVSV